MRDYQKRRSSTGKTRNLKKICLENEEFKKNSCFPPGSFYSPIVSVQDIQRRKDKIWNTTPADGIPGIELKTEQQLNLLRQLSVFYNEMPFRAEKQPDIRYYFENEFYSYTDAIVLYSMIRYFRPGQIIEVGSGFSSAVMLDTDELFFDGTIKMTFIEPYPERLLSLLKKDDEKKKTVIEDNVQNVSPDKFAELQSGDFLFIDSSHVVKTGSDVNYILFEVLPVIPTGVLIHFHDMFYPFEYPVNWVLRGRNWNEDYFLRAFLMYNDKFEIRLFSHYIHQHFKDGFREMPLSYKNAGGNLWLEKK